MEDHKRGKCPALWVDYETGPRIQPGEQDIVVGLYRGPHIVLSNGHGGLTAKLSDCPSGNCSSFQGRLGEVV